MAHSDIKFASIPEAIEDIRNGKFVIVMDDEDRENEGDLIMAASLATPERVAFCVNYTTGILCAPMPASRATELQLPIMVHSGNDPNQTAFTITTDSIDTTTGVSASDRSITFKQLADYNFKASHFRRPGHIFPLIARPGGVLERNGHTEASVDLCRLAGLPPVGLIGEMVNFDGTMKRLDDCAAFGKEHDIKLITIEQLIAYRIQQEQLQGEQSLKSSKQVQGVEIVAQCEIPIKLHGKDLGHWTLKCFYSHFDGRHHVSVERGDITREPYDPVLTRIHSECFTGDILGSQRCDCGEQLFKSLELIAARGRGVLIYNVGHEGRGIGLANKILAYHLQQTKKMDTYAANKALGFQDDLRKYDTARAIIKALGIEKIQILTGNNTKIDAFQDMVASVHHLEGTPNPHNHAYLDAKRKKNATPQPANTSAVVETTSSESVSSIVQPVPQTPVKQPSIQEDAPAQDKIPAHIKSVPINLPIPTISGDLKIGIVRTSWNESLVGPFTAAIHQNLLDGKIHPDNITTLLVPGSFEVPWAAKMLASKCDAVICIGLLIKGETMHFEMISQSVAQGLMNLQLDSGVPMINAVLNCMTEGQAEARCGPDSQLPGSLASTAIHMAALKHGWKPDTMNAFRQIVPQPCGNN